MDRQLKTPEQLLACRTLEQILAARPRGVHATSPADTGLSALRSPRGPSSPGRFHRCRIQRRENPSSEPLANNVVLGAHLDPRIVGAQAVEGPVAAVDYLDTDVQCAPWIRH